MKINSKTTNEVRSAPNGTGESKFDIDNNDGPTHIGSKVGDVGKLVFRPTHWISLLVAFDRERTNRMTLVVVHLDNAPGGHEAEGSMCAEGSPSGGTVTVQATRNFFAGLTNRVPLALSKSPELRSAQFARVTQNADAFAPRSYGCVNGRRSD